MDPVTAGSFRRDFGLAQKDVQTGVSSGRASASNSHWNKWTNYVRELALDPLLEAIQDKIPFLQVFGRRIRTGALSASQRPVKSRQVEDYLRTIGQTFMAMGHEDPRLGKNLQLDHRLQRMLKTYSKLDPPPNRVKPVPVQVLRHISAIALASNRPFLIGVADMITIAFFFLLRPGEYTDSTSDTTPFQFADVQLFLGEQRLDLSTAPPASISAATFATLTFTDQKNGVRGEVIGLARSGCPTLCPVISIIRRILHLRLHNASPSCPLARVYTTRWEKITPTDITTTLRQAVTFLSPASLGFLPSDVSARCLRAAGANALLCAKVDSDVIRLLGRWRSDEMLRYLHLQAAPIMRNFSRDMLQGGTFTLIPNQLVPQQL